MGLVRSLLGDTSPIITSFAPEGRATAFSRAVGWTTLVSVDGEQEWDSAVRVVDADGLRPFVFSCLLVETRFRLLLP